MAPLDRGLTRRHARPRRGNLLDDLVGRSHATWRSGATGPVAGAAGRCHPESVPDSPPPDRRRAIARLTAAKGGQTVAVCLPARDEEATVGAICRAVRRELMAPAGAPLVDDLVVIDNSRDRTAAVASAAGARVVAVDDILTGAGPGIGKGDALWKSLAATGADLIVWCDADLTSFHAGYITALLEPLLADERIVLVKAHYERLLNGGPGGGRTTELMARPLLALFFPELAHLRQPLAGEYAVRRRAVEQVPFVQGWGVEIALLIDLARRFGADCIAEADLGVREHRNRPLGELSAQALEILQTVLQRAGVDPPSGRWEAALPREAQDPAVAVLRERPALASLRPETVAGADGSTHGSPSAPGRGHRPLV